MDIETIIASVLLGLLIGIGIGYLIFKIRTKYISKTSTKKIKQQDLKGDGEFKELASTDTRLSEGDDLPKREEEIVKEASASPLPIKDNENK